MYIDIGKKKSVAELISYFKTTWTEGINTGKIDGSPAILGVLVGFSKSST